MKLNMKRLLSMVLAAGMLVSLLPMQSYGFEPEIRAESTHTTQMSSAVELVYPSVYTDEIRTQNFDDNWKFFFGNADGAESKTFNDSEWREVNLPHDYSIEQNYSGSLEAESGYLPGGTGWYRKTFSIPESAEGKRVRIDFGGVYMNATVWINGHLLGKHPYGYTPFSFDLSDYIKIGEENTIAVKVEHKIPSSRWYSGSGIYRSVNLTITDPVHIALYGNKITTSDISNDRQNVSVNISTKVENTLDAAKEVYVKSSIYKKGSNDLIAQSSSEAVSIASNDSQLISSSISIESPELWSVESPELYTITVEVMSQEELLDKEEIDYGFRYYNFDKDRGFSLNGENIKLKGVCMHHDQGALGAVANSTAIRRQVEILKDMGCNSIRVTHNPAAIELIKACDELGILVIDEAFDGWHINKNGNTFDYAVHFERPIGADNKILGGRENMTWAEFDLKTMVNRGFNSPSIIMWSLGNEVTEGAREEAKYVNVINRLIPWVKEVDTSRFVTAGDNKIKRYSNLDNIFARMNQAIADADGIVGFNYADTNQLRAWHQRRPDWKMYASETASAVNSRGIYKINGYTGKNSNKQLTAYDKSTVGWGMVSSQSWYNIIQKDYIAGEYIWTGFDYIGEPTNWNGTGPGAPHGWPAPKNSFFGIVDTAGLPKDRYYLYRSLWNNNDITLHVLPAWNENVVENVRGNVPVVVYSNAKSVRLMFTPEGSNQERDLGLKAFTTMHSDGNLYTYQMYRGNDKSNTEHENLYLTWNVPFEAGSIRAIAYEDEAGTQVISDTVGRNIVKTTGAASKIRLKQYNSGRDLKADGKDLAYIEVDITDANGNIVPDADNRVSFSVEGEGKLVGLDNGNAMDHDSYKIDSRRAFSGKLVAIVQTTRTGGEITLRATGEGLEEAQISLSSQAVTSENAGSRRVLSYSISKNYYVKKDNAPNLPDSITVNYTDGTSSNESIVWETIAPEKISTIGSFSVKGRLADGFEIFVNITMIDRVEALLNYSTSVPVGQAPVLPQSRPAVLENGDVLKVNFPVTWEPKDVSEYSSAGIVRVNGRADVLGEILNVTADIRVQNENIVIGESISPYALNLTQNIGGHAESDTLNAIKDNRREVSANNQGGANPTIWSNWSAAQAGHNTAELTFQYATQARLGQVVIYFAKDTSSLRYPDPETTQIYVSEDGQDDNWVRLDTQEVIADTESSTNVKAYTYNFAPATFTFVKIIVKNSTVPTGTNRRASIGISEIELRKANGSFNTYSTAQIESLNINGVNVSNADLRAMEHSTPALFVDEIQMHARENAALTFVEAKKDSERSYIIVESEDNKRREKFIINLNSQNSSNDPEDASKDYPYDEMTIAVGDQQAQEPASNANDGNENNVWHTNWRTPAPLNKRWISMELDEPKLIDGLRYLARYDQSNGRVKEYKVQVSEDNTNWQEVAAGIWQNSGGWKLASFAPVRAKYIKLVGVHTYSDPGHAADKFMSAAEMRVRLAAITTDISDEEQNITATIEKDKYIVDRVEAPITPKLTLTKDGQELKYGIDYRVKYERNDRAGRAFAIAEGILKYSGAIRVPFDILSKSSRSVSVEKGNITYVQGLEYMNSSGEFEPGQEIRVAAEPQDFAYWRVMPEGVNIADKTQASISFIMPENSVRLRAVYLSELDDKLDVYTRTNLPDWLAYAKTDDMENILSSHVAEEEIAALDNNKRIDLRLNLERSENMFAIATPSQATPSDGSGSIRDMLMDTIREDESLREAFYIKPELFKEVTEDGNVLSSEKLTQRHTMLIKLEVPKKDRNMSDYKVLAYKKVGDEIAIDVIDSIEEAGFISFVLSTDAIYGVFYNQSYNIKFLDYDSSVIDSQIVKLGNMPVVPLEPQREGYSFIGWDKQVVEAKKDAVYKAVYEKEFEEYFDVSKERLETEINNMTAFLDSAEADAFTKASLRVLERAINKANRIIDNTNTRKLDLDNMYNELRGAYMDLVRKSNTGSGSNAGNAGAGSPSGSGSNAGSSSGGGFSGSGSLRGGSSGGGRREAGQKGDRNNAKLVDYKSLSGAWQQKGNTWQFVLDNGSLFKGAWGYISYNNTTEWYYFDKDGNMLDGWFKDNKGDWYFLNDKSDGKRGAMLTGWHWIMSKDGKYRCYYFNERADGRRGAMEKDKLIDNKYLLNSEGQWIVNSVVQTK